MATVSHHIRSHYNPEQDKARLQLETGQLEANALAEANPGGAPPELAEGEEDPWLTEKPFGVSARVLRPPRFVPATTEYNEWGSNSNALERAREEKKDDDEKESVASWYRSLARKTPMSSASGTPRSGTPISAPTLAPTPQASTSKVEQPAPSQTSRKTAIRKDRNNWFIARVLEASSSGSSGANSPLPGVSTPSSSSSTPAPTLADILERDPPPLPTEEKYTPPVWIAIGPSNRGFAMLQKGGWEEGEALGRASRNRSGLGYKGKGKERELGDDEQVEGAVIVKQEVIDLDAVDHEIIDLTLSDDEEEQLISTSTSSNLRNPPMTSSPSTSIPTPQPSSTDLDHAPRALLVPLPTILKSDRLGIGLKAKYTGSGLHRAPVRRVTHSQASLEANARAADEQRRMKELVGRGRRGFERKNKEDEKDRRALLAYLNM